MAKKRSSKKKAGRPPPKCKAILLCDTVIVDAMTGKPTSYQITVEIHDLRDDRVIARAEIAQMDFPDRATKGNLIIPVPPLPLQHDGVYDFVVLADGQEIDRQQFTARAAGGSEDGSNQPEEPEGE